MEGVPTKSLCLPFFCVADGNWWWGLDHEWWYFDQARNGPTHYQTLCDRCCRITTWVSADTSADWSGPIPPTWDWKGMGGARLGRTCDRQGGAFWQRCELDRLVEVAKQVRVALHHKAGEAMTHNFAYTSTLGLHFSGLEGA